MTSTQTNAPRDLGPAVRFPPPLPFALAFLVGSVLDRLVPLPVVVPRAAWTGAVGAGLFFAGVALVLTGVYTFRNARTAIYPNRPARNLVTHGIYAYTRNPMYLGFSVAYLGGVVATGSLWCLLLLPFVLIGIVTQVIHREERHLRERFPDEFAEYSARVRRWV